VGSGDAGGGLVEVSGLAGALAEVSGLVGAAGSLDAGAATGMSGLMTPAPESAGGAEPAFGLASGIGDGVACGLGESSPDSAGGLDLAPGLASGTGEGVGCGLGELEVSVGGDGAAEGAGESRALGLAAAAGDAEREAGLETGFDGACEGACEDAAEGDGSAVSDWRDASGAGEAGVGPGAWPRGSAAKTAAVSGGRCHSA
jgi:hypothetical protein